MRRNEFSGRQREDRQRSVQFLRGKVELFQGARLYLVHKRNPEKRDTKGSEVFDFQERVRPQRSQRCIRFSRPQNSQEKYPEDGRDLMLKTRFEQTYIYGLF